MINSKINHQMLYV